MIYYLIVHPANVAKFGNNANTLKEGFFEEWDKRKIKAAFNFGNGTEKDFEEFLKDNKFIIVEKWIT